MFRAAIFLSIATLAAAQSPDQAARDIFKQLIEINTTDSIGNTTTAANAMAKRLIDAGYPAADVKVLGPNDRKGNMVARLRGTGTGGLKPIVIFGHLDVVEAKREDWTSDPFQFVEKDGYFYGRGTQDMKEYDAALVTDFVRFKKEGWRPDRDLILALTADEEGGKSNGVDWLIKNHRDLIDAEFAIHAEDGGVTTKKGKPVNVDVEAAEKLYSDYEVSATNSGGHSSLPVPDNAIYHVTDALSRLEASPFPVELNPVTRAYFERRANLESDQVKADMNAILHNPPDAAAVIRLSKEPTFNSMLRTTCIATRLNAGHANNALPQSATAIVNCRILPGHSSEEIRLELAHIFADPKVRVRYVSDGGEFSDEAPAKKAFPPVMTPPDLMKPLEKVAAEMWPGAPVIPGMATGASDAIYTVAAGIPSYGIGGVAIDEDDIRAHGKDERVRMSAYYDNVRFFYLYLKALGTR
jgi:acetylornithine deacetylase/succinyl-diaminopimelate desuccinylase-like protein